jgi:DNA-binding CsgD family transcriptional regulator
MVMAFSLPGDKAASKLGTTPPAVRRGTARGGDGTVRDADQLSSFIGQIYDAAVEPGLWPAVLRRAAGFVGGTVAALYYKDAATNRGNVYYDCGRNDPHYKRLYFDNYIKIDPTSAGLCFREVGKPMGVGDILDFDEFHASRFYQEWVRPQHWADAMSVALDKTATGAALFTVFRLERQGLVDAEARRRMRLIAPHVRRAALIGRAIEHRTAEAATFADTLDGLSAGMFLVDADGRIVHANAAGRMMLREGFVLRSACGKLAATEARAARALAEAVTAAKGGDAAVGSRGIAVPLPGREGDGYVAHALPLTSAARRAGARYAAVAALFVQKATRQMRSVPEVLARVFRLTPSELRVLLAIIEKGGVPETAEALGIGQATVKTHLHRVFCKTGTRRQTELVKLVAGFCSPLAG